MMGDWGECSNGLNCTSRQVESGIWIAQQGEWYSLLYSNYSVISNYLFVGRSDYFVERSDYFLERSDRKMERNDLERSDYETKWPDTTELNLNRLVLGNKTLAFGISLSFVSYIDASYLVGPPCRFVFSSIPLDTILYSSPAAGAELSMVNSNRASKALFSRLHTSFPAGLLGR